jgi:hypothetical protein
MIHKVINRRRFINDVRVHEAQDTAGRPVLPIIQLLCRWGIDAWKYSFVTDERRMLRIDRAVIASTSRLFFGIIALE